MKKWQLYPKIEADFVIQSPEISPLFLQLLFNRGFKELDEIKAFLHNELISGKTKKIGNYSFYDPFLFKDMESAVALIISHLKKGDKIMIYGDYDADGVTSSALLLEALKTLQAKVEVYLPDRAKEGYGLNKKAIDQIKQQGFKLLITVDNGVRNKIEIDYAQAQGLAVIVTDHHVLPAAGELPNCPLIDPANKRDNYPWPFLAGVGVAFKLLSALLLRSKLTTQQKQLILEQSLDLVALGTIADMVSLLGENRLLVKSGLEIINRNRRLGLNELIKVTKIKEGRTIQAWNIGWQIGPRLNAASRLGHANTAFGLLTATDRIEAKTLALELDEKNTKRQEITEKISAQVEKNINPDNLPDLIIGIATEEQAWHEGVIGLIAGRIAEKYYRPTLIITRLEEDGKISFKGSGRSIEELNLIQTITDCADYLDKYGGHPMACGFSIKSEEQLNKFKKKVTQLATQKLKGLDLIAKLKIEAELDLKKIDLTLAEEINSLAPFGQHNPQPNFISYQVKINDIITMGLDSQHIKFKFDNIWALAFGKSQEYKDFQIGDKVDLVYYLEINDFNGRCEAQLKIIDIRKI